MSIGSATPKLRFTLQPGVVPRTSKVSNPASVSPTSGPLNSYPPNPPINKELTRSPDGPSKPDDRLTFASVVKDVGGLSGYRQTLAVVAIVASATAFIGPAIGAGAVVVGAKVVAGAASLVSGFIGVSTEANNYNHGIPVNGLNVAGSAFQAAAGGALVGENLPALAAAFAGGTAVNAAKAAHDPSLPNVAVAILGVGGLASQGCGEHEQLGGALHLLQEFFSLNATNPLENVAGVPAQLVGPLNSNATETAKDYAANAPLNLSSDPIAIKKGLISVSALSKP